MDNVVVPFAEDFLGIPLTTMGTWASRGIRWGMYIFVLLSVLKVYMTTRKLLGYDQGQAVVNVNVKR